MQFLDIMLNGNAETRGQYTNYLKAKALYGHRNSQELRSKIYFLLAAIFWWFEESKFYALVI